MFSCSWCGLAILLSPFIFGIFGIVDPINSYNNLHVSQNVAIGMFIIYFLIVFSGMTRYIIIQKFKEQQEQQIRQPEQQIRQPEQQIRQPEQEIREQEIREQEIREQEIREQEIREQEQQIKLQRNKIQRNLIISTHISQECPICMTNMNNIILTCGHCFCDKCINNCKNHNNNKCPICREDIVML